MRLETKIMATTSVPEDNPVWQQALFFVVVLALVAVSVFMAWWITTDWRVSQAARNWPTTEGQIISSSIDSCRNCESGPWYHADITFQYSVEGRTYTREQWTLGSTGFDYERDVQRILQRYPPGATANVTYDPSNPKRGYLDPTFSMPFSIWLTAAGLLAGLLMLIREGMRRAPKLLRWLRQRSRNPVS